MAQACLEAEPLIVVKTGEKDNLKISKAHESRDLVVLATQALIPLLSSDVGRNKLRGNLSLLNSLTEHLSIGDV